MDGMARAMGGSSTIKWKGRTYELPPLQMRDWATIENECLKRRRDAIMAAAASLYGKLPDDVWQRQVDSAVKKCELMSEVPAAEVQAWMETSAGVAFTLWLSLERKYSGEFVLEDMLEVISTQLPKEEVDKLIAARDQANGLDVAGNETGLPQ